MTSKHPVNRPSESNFILLVEDDPTLSGYLSSSLTDVGYHVQATPDRASALSVLGSALPPSMLLLDLGLPPHASTMSEGLSLLDAALQLVPGIKVIVLTGQDEDAAALKAPRRLRQVPKSNCSGAPWSRPGTTSPRLRANLAWPASMFTTT